MPVAPEVEGPASKVKGKGGGSSKALIFSGILLMGMGVLAAFLVHKEFPKLINALAVVDSKHGLGYKTWSGNSGKAGAPRYYSYSFSTITNADAFLGGEAPEYEEKGPYVFKTQYKRVGVNFEDHGNVVTFSEKLVNHFDAKSSKGALTDDLTILNPAWSSIVSTYRTEGNVKKGAAGVALGKLWDSFYDFMVPLSRLDTLHSALVKARDGLALAMTVVKYPPNSFYAAWGGNCVTTADGKEICNYSDLSWIVDAHLLPSKADRQYVLLDMLINVPFKTRIAPEKAQRIWDSNEPYSILSFQEMNSTLTAHGYFLGLSSWVEATTDANKAQMLARHFDISVDQVLTLAKHLDRAKDNNDLFEEVKGRYLATVPVAKRPLLPDINTVEDLLWWQVYSADVMPVLKNDPEARLKKEAKLEFGWYAQTMGMTWDQTGLSFKTIYCLFDHANANVDELQVKLLGLDRWWVADKAPEFTSFPNRSPKYSFDECFPDQATIEGVQGYLHYLVNLFFVPAYNSDMERNGLVATKTVGTWLLGDGPLSIIQNALRRPDDPRINFSLMIDDESLDGEAACDTAGDVTQAYTACYRIRDGEKLGQAKYVRGNYTMFTGKDDINQVGQLKRLYGQEVMTGVWAKPLPVLNGAAIMARDTNWDLKPLVPGHIDGLAVPPGILTNTEALDDGFISFMIESVSVPVPLIYEGDVERMGIKLRRFVMHPDALTARRPDAATFSMGHPGTPPEMLEVLNLTEARQCAAFIGAVQAPIVRANEAKLETNAATIRKEPPRAMSPETVSYIEFEPITGMAMRVNLQVQSYTTTLPQFADYNIWFPQVHQAALIPLFKLRIQQDVSPSQARTFRRVVYGAKTIAKATYIAGFVLGGVLMLIGVALHLRHSRKTKLAAKNREPGPPPPTINL